MTQDNSCSFSIHSDYIYFQLHFNFKSAIMNYFLLFLSALHWSTGYIHIWITWSHIFFKGLCSHKWVLTYFQALTHQNLYETKNKHFPFKSHFWSIINHICTSFFRHLSSLFSYQKSIFVITVHFISVHFIQQNNSHLQLSCITFTL